MAKYSVKIRYTPPNGGTTNREIQVEAESDDAAERRALAQFKSSGQKFADAEAVCVKKI